MWDVYIYHFCCRQSSELVGHSQSERVEVRRLQAIWVGAELGHVVGIGLEGGCREHLPVVRNRPLVLEVGGTCGAVASACISLGSQQQPCAATSSAVPGPRDGHSRHDFRTGVNGDSLGRVGASLQEVAQTSSDGQTTLSAT